MTLLLALAGGHTGPAAAQQEPIPTQRIVVTGHASPVEARRASIAVTGLDADEIRFGGHDGAADVLRSLPGLLVQSSGGEGNANIGVRGLPLSGGAKFLLFLEDGLPVVAFGDIDFGTADTFVRIDDSVERVEVVRGGSAATLTSHAPGGVVNLISRTGDDESGNLTLTAGLGMDRQRLSFAKGGALGPRWRYHVGGHHRVGEGVRTVGYTAERGGQIKGNLTREFDAGHLRLHLRLLDDRAPVFLPVPMSITAGSGGPRFASLPGFDLGQGAMQSAAFRDDLSVDRDGNVRHTDIADGYRSTLRALGVEAGFDIAPGWRAEARARRTAISGRFVGPYPAEVGTAAALAEAIGGDGATLRYATGPRAGQAVDDPATLGGNGLAVRTHLFNTTLHSLDHDAMDLRLARSGLLRDVQVTATVGFYASRQAIDQDWHWNTYLQEVKGDGAALLDVVRADGTLATQRGLVAYGEPFWGNCCVRSYRLRYETQAPYLALQVRRGALDVDASLRQDRFSADGTYAGAGDLQALDVDGDGRLQDPETRVPQVDADTAMPVHYRVHYRSYSLGANLLWQPDLAVFARLSRGGRGNAERVLFGGGVRPDGSIAKAFAVNTVDQRELGVRWQGARLDASATLFEAETRVVDQDITSPTERFFQRTYRARGLELEGAWRQGPWRVRGSVTWTSGRIVADQITPDRVGEPINPRWMFNLAPSVRAGSLAGGLNLIGTSAFPSTRGGLASPGFVQVNAFVEGRIGRDWTIALTVNNLFDRIGITEIPNASGGVTADGLNTARSIPGRSVQLAVRHAL